MKSYRDLVQEYPELGDFLAEFENRISRLEASNYSQEPTTEVKHVELAVGGAALKALEGRLLKQIQYHSDKNHTQRDPLNTRMVDKPLDINKLSKTYWGGEG